MSDGATPSLSPRRLLELVGASVGGSATYQFMTRLGFASESPYRGAIKLEGDPKGSSGINRFEVRGLQGRVCSSIRRGHPRAEC